MASMSAIVIITHSRNAHRALLAFAILMPLSRKGQIHEYNRIIKVIIDIL